MIFVCSRHAGGQAIPGYTGRIHWEPVHVHVWFTTNTKYSDINNTMGHTCVAVCYNSCAGRDKTIPFYRFVADPDRKKQMDSSSKQRLSLVQKGQNRHI